jgi:two-component system, chemotaxis family, protein-glutamate methylesterase/glutaminase
VPVPFPASDDAVHVAGPVNFDIVAIGASAGGVEALDVVVRALPETFYPAVLIVQHLDPRRHSQLPYLLGRHARLPVKPASHDDPIVAGTIYVAPPDVHLLVAHGQIELSRSKLVHFTRPSVDLLFESVAGEYGPRSIGVVLTGTGVDGATGVRALKGVGGTTIAQDPSGAAHRGMPQAACATGCVDFVLPLSRIGAALIELTESGAYQDTRLAE